MWNGFLNNFWESIWPNLWSLSIRRSQLSNGNIELKQERSSCNVVVVTPIVAFFLSNTSNVENMGFGENQRARKSVAHTTTIVISLEHRGDDDMVIKTAWVLEWRCMQCGRCEEGVCRLVTQNRQNRKERLRALSGKARARRCSQWRFATSRRRLAAPRDGRRHSFIISFTSLHPR